MQAAVTQTKAGDTVFLDPGHYTGGNNRDVLIRHNLTIIGAGKGLTVLDAGALGRHFVVNEARLSLRRLACINGRVGLSAFEGDNLMLNSDE